MILPKINKIINHPNFKPAISGFIKESAKHPYLMSKEISHWLFGMQEPKAGVRFEQHCHSHFSDGANLADIIELLFDKCITVWSLTDHHNSNAFNKIANGTYNLNSNSKTNRKFDVEIQHDKRALTIYSGNKSLVLLRSVEYYTNKGEINIHGYSGKILKPKQPLEDAIKFGIDNGGWVAINHVGFYQGIGFNGRKEVEKAVKAGAIAIEKNGTEILIQIFSAVQAEAYAKEFGLALLASGDAHKLHMYGLSGLTFEDKNYRTVLKQCNGSHADTIKTLVEEHKFETYLNYISFSQFKDFRFQG